jgi:L-ascorbate metabolism protein UlaG (beta-lactamase superfamily)
MSTVDGQGAAAIVRELQPKWIVPMHYRTAAISFLEPEDAFLEAMQGTEIRRLTETSLETGARSANGASVLILPAVPTART